tara:strand:+ start:8329 stop:10875 length:2547 start_codon:yes stop_codon:yes gene_type:complete
MSKKVFSSPLRHKEGNEAAHGMRADETTWHAENPDVPVGEDTEEESTYGKLNTSLTGQTEKTEKSSFVSNIFDKAKETLDEIQRKKTNKIIKVNQELKAGKITEKEAEEKRKYFDRIYDVTNLDDVHYNIEIEKVKAQNISDEEKRAEIDAINDNKILYHLGDTPDLHTNMGTGSSIVTEQDMSYINMEHEKAAEVLWDGLTDFSEEDLESTPVTYYEPPTYSTDVVPTSTERFAQAQETAKEIEEEKFLQNDLLDEILKEYSTNLYAIDNDLDYKTAAQHYREKSWEDFGTQYQINYEDLSEVGSKLTPEEIDGIKNTFIERRSDKLTIAKLKKDVVNHYDKHISFFQHGLSRKQVEESSALEKIEGEGNDKLKVFSKRYAIIDGTRRNNIEEIDKIDKNLGEVSYGTVLRNGETLKDKDGKEITLPYSDEIQSIILKQEKIASEYTEDWQQVEKQEKIEELNKEIDGLLKDYGQLIDTREIWVRGLKNTDQLLKEELKNKNLVARNVEQYKAIQSVTDHYYGGLYRIAGATTMSVFDTVAAIDEIGYSITGINISSEDGRKAIDDFREISKQKLGGEADKGLGGINSVTDLSQYTAELVFGNSVIFASSIISGGVTAPILVGGTTGAGLDYERTRLEIEKGEYFYDPWQRHLSAGLHFGVEALSEIVLAKQVLRVADDMAIDNTFKTGWSSYIGDMLNLGTRTGTDAFQSGFSESLAAVGGNASDRYVLKKDVHLLDGASSGFVDGVLMSFGPKSVSVFHATTKHLLSDSQLTTLAENSKRLHDINNLLNNSENLSEEVRLSLEKQQNDIVNESNKIKDAQLKGSITYTDQEKQDLIDIDVDRYNL